MEEIKNTNVWLEGILWQTETSVFFFFLIDAGAKWEDWQIIWFESHDWVIIMIKKNNNFEIWQQPYLLWVNILQVSTTTAVEGFTFYNSRMIWGVFCVRPVHLYTLVGAQLKSNRVWLTWGEVRCGDASSVTALLNHSEASLSSWGWGERPVCSVCCLIVSISSLLSQRDLRAVKQNELKLWDKIVLPFFHMIHKVVLVVPCGAAPPNKLNSLDSEWQELQAAGSPAGHWR